METLCLHRADGELLLRLDLSEKPAALTVGASPDAALSLAPWLRAGDAPLPAVAAALIRDADGWRLVSAEPTLPLTLNGAPVPEARLAPGVTCGLGGFLLRMAGEAAARSAVTLLWTWRGARGTRSAPLAEGENLVALPPGGDAPEANPPVAGEPLFRLVLEGNALTALMPEREGAPPEWLRVGLGDGFRVGGFTGVALATAEADRALKTRHPLAWPGRGIRLRLALCAVGAVLALLLMGHLARETQAARRALAARGALSREIPATRTPAIAPASTLGDDARVYELDFHRALPELLTATPQPSADFLLSRGAALLARAQAEKDATAEAALARKMALLRGLRALQTAVAGAQWQALRDAVADADPEAFRYYDAEPFLADARALSAFVSETLPALYATAAARGADAFAEADRTLGAAMEALRANRFATEAVTAPLRALALRRWAALRAHVAARDAFLRDPMGVAAGDAARDAFSELEDAFAGEELPGRERQALGEAARKALRARLAPPGPQAADEAPLRGLARFLRAIGAEPEAAREAAQAADALARETARQGRALHARYRLQRLANDPKAEATLAELLAFGTPENPFRRWAERERQRLQAQPPAPASPSPSTPAQP